MPTNRSVRVAIETAAELHRVLDRLVPMLERVRDAVVQEPRQRRDRRRAEVAANHVAAERQRQPAGAIGPPLAEIDDLLQPLVRVRQLSFVNQQTGRDLRRDAPAPESDRTA